MKHQQVVPDYVVMLESSITVLALVGCGWLLFKLVSACFYFPQYMKSLELEAEKANRHVEKSLLPKGSIEEEEPADVDTEKGEPSKENDNNEEETAAEEKFDEGSSEDDEKSNKLPEKEETEKPPEEEEAEVTANESKKDK